MQVTTARDGLLVNLNDEDIRNLIQGVSSLQGYLRCSQVDLLEERFSSYQDHLKETIRFLELIVWEVTNNER